MRHYGWQPWDLERLTPKMIRDAVEDLKHHPPMF